MCAPLELLPPAAAAAAAAAGLRVRETGLTGLPSCLAPLPSVCACAPDWRRSETAGRALPPWPKAFTIETLRMRVSPLGETDGAHGSACRAAEATRSGGRQASGGRMGERGRVVSRGVRARVWRNG